MSTYFAYIVSSLSGTLYVGVTNDLVRRIYEHKNKLINGFTAKYDVELLVYYEETSSVETAITREKQLKGWNRKKKIALIESANPDWSDLSEGWFE